MSRVIFILCSAFILKCSCYETDSSEGSVFETTPFYEAIIFSDMADIINEFKGKEKTPTALPIMNSDDESEEDVEDLLSEYQHYLDKAHKQTINYFGSPKAKNKVPRFRHDRFMKLKTPLTTNTILPSLGFPSFNNPSNLFIPINTKYGKAGENKIVDYFRKGLFEPSSCFCKNDEIPCKCDCKQCLFSWELKSLHPNTEDKVRLDDNLLNQQTPVFVDSTIKNPDIKDNTINIRIKLDVQLPKHECCKKNNSEKKNDAVYIDTPASSISVPFSYYNIPMPLDLLDIKRQDSFSPLHKITIHKKRRNRNNSNKKHKKKFISFHNINVEPQTMPQILEETQKISYFLNVSDTNKSTNVEPVNTDSKAVNITLNQTILDTADTNNENEKQVKDHDTFLNVSVTRTAADDNHNLTNSIETETITYNKVTTEKPTETRVKRDVNDLVSNKSINVTSPISLIPVKAPSSTTISTESKKRKEIKLKKADQDISDSELLYWPIDFNKTTSTNSKNITKIIMERENSKVKLNATKDIIQNNHKKIVEQAIFGAVDWDDVDTIAPVFISFVGKYMKGALTFCSQSICHSMKCGEQVCVYRFCEPKDRHSQRGHCIGSNSTDSKIIMESIMDLPSNIGLEIVDILQDKLLGKIFGKTTLCMNSKCITFAASKKIFIKLKCLVKDLNDLGHCHSAKNTKTV